MARTSVSFGLETDWWLQSFPRPKLQTSYLRAQCRYHRVVLTTITSSIGRIRAEHGVKLFRFGAVSAFNVVFGQILLYTSQTVLDWAPVPANIFSVAVGTIPAYFLSRYWVWEKRGKSHLTREVLPFWIITFVGFAISTVAVWFVAAQWDPSPIVINLTNLAAFGVVWVAKFLILDRMLFKPEEPIGAKTA